MGVVVKSYVEIVQHYLWMTPLTMGWTAEEFWFASWQDWF